MADPDTTNIKGRMQHIPLPPSILAAFNIPLPDPGIPSSIPVLLPGGEGTSYHHIPSSTVFKPTRDPFETEILSTIVAQLPRSTPAFRTAQPIPSIHGTYVHAHWTCTTCIANVRGLSAPDGEYTPARLWQIIQTSRSFHAALRTISLPPSHLSHLQTHASHVWAHAHRLAWTDPKDTQTLLSPFSLPSPNPYPALVQRLIDLATRLGDAPHRNTALYHSPASQLIHADFVGPDNLLFPLDLEVTPDRAPVVIDLSPTIGPESYAEGIILGDALIWYGVGVEVLEVGGEDCTPLRMDMVRRGVLFRALTDVGLFVLGGYRAREDVVRIERVVGLLEAFVAERRWLGAGG